MNVIVTTEKMSVKLMLFPHASVLFLLHIVNFNLVVRVSNVPDGSA